MTFGRRRSFCGDGEEFRECDVELVLIYGLQLLWEQVLTAVQHLRVNLLHRRNRRPTSLRARATEEARVVHDEILPNN